MCSFIHSISSIYILEVQICVCEALVHHSLFPRCITGPPRNAWMIFISSETSERDKCLLVHKISLKNPSIVVKRPNISFRFRTFQIIDIQIIFLPEIQAERLSQRLRHVFYHYTRPIIICRRWLRLATRAKYIYFYLRNLSTLSKRKKEKTTAFAPVISKIPATEVNIFIMTSALSMWTEGP